MGECKMKKLFLTFFFYLCGSSHILSSEIPTNWENFLQNSEYLPCASTLFNNDNNSTALLHAKKASFATGKIIESLDIISLTFCENIISNNSCDIRKTKTISDFKKCSLESNLLQCVLDYPFISDESSMIEKIPFLSSLGLHDACYEIPEYHYCSILVMNQPIWSYGICVPATCSTKEIEISLNKLFLTKGGIIPSTYTNKLFTSTCGDYSYPKTTGTIVMICLCCLLIFLLIIGTFIHIYKNSLDGIIYTICKCFSLKKNFNSLLSFSPTKEGSFDCFNGIRVFSILWVIFGHTFVFTMTGLSFTNLEDLIGTNNEGWISTYPAQALTSAYFAVDTFFLMSGFLATHILMKRADEFIRNEKISIFFLQVPFFYLKRFLRLTPTYFFILFFYLKILPQLESGPFWNLLNTDINFCNKYWWTNLLYINNIYPSSDSAGCYAVTWYLANDFQFFLIVPFVAFLAVYSVKNYSHLISITILTIGCILSIIFAFIESYDNNWSINIYDQNFITGYFSNYYTKPWFRCPPYLIGMIFAIVWFYYFDEKNSPFIQENIENDQETPLLPNEKPKKIKIWNNFLKKNITLKNILFLLSLTLFTVLILGARGAYSNIPSLWSDTRMSLYISLSKPSWTLGICVLSLLLFLKELPLIHLLLTNRFIIIISRLTYCMYLIHPSILYWYYFSQTYPAHFNDPWYIMTFLSIVFATILVSIIVYLAVEKPISNLQKVLFKI